MIDKQALNKKLAEWAGFKEFNWSEDESGILMWSDEGKCREWLDFTDSLDACFKWIVKDNWAVSINSKTTCILTIPRPKGVYGSDNYVGQRKGEPALALCLALEKMIDSEEKK